MLTGMTGRIANEGNQSGFLWIHLNKNLCSDLPTQLGTVGWESSTNFRWEEGTAIGTPCCEVADLQASGYTCAPTSVPTIAPTESDYVSVEGTVVFSGFSFAQANSAFLTAFKEAVAELVSGVNNASVSGLEATDVTGESRRLQDAPHTEDKVGLHSLGRWEEGGLKLGGSAPAFVPVGAKWVNVVGKDGDTTRRLNAESHGPTPMPTVKPVVSVSFVVGKSLDGSTYRNGSSLQSAVYDGLSAVYEGGGKRRLSQVRERYDSKYATDGDGPDRRRLDESEHASTAPTASPSPTVNSFSALSEVRALVPSTSPPFPLHLFTKNV